MRGWVGGWEGSGLPREMKAKDSWAAPSPVSHFLSVALASSTVGSVGLFRMGLWITAPVALLKSLINVIHLVTAARNMAALDAADRAKKK